MRLSQKLETPSRKKLRAQQLFGILGGQTTGKYMRAKDLATDPMLNEMPGPWGRALRYLRERRNLTRKAVAKRAGMTPTTYGRIERGHHTQTQQLQDLADVFEVPIEEVLALRPENLDRHMGTVRAQSEPATGTQLHVQGPPFQPAEQADKIRALESHVQHLSQQLAELVAEKTPTDHRSRKRVSAARPRESVRPGHARKPR